MTNIIEENRVEELKPGETVIGKITGAYNGEMASFDLFYGGLASSNSKGKALFKVSDDEHLKYLRDFLVNDKSGQNFRIPSAAEVNEVTKKIKSKEYIKEYQAKQKEEEQRKIDEEKKKEAEAREKAEKERIVKEKELEEKRIALEKEKAEREKKEAEERRILEEKKAKEEAELAKKREEIEKLAKEMRAPKGNIFDGEDSSSDASIIDDEVCAIDEAKLAKEIAAEMAKIAEAKNAGISSTADSIKKRRKPSNVYDAKTGEIILEPSKSVAKLSFYGKLFRVLAFVIPVISLIVAIISIIASMNMPMGMGGFVAVPTIVVTLIASLISYMTFDIKSLKLYNRANIEYSAEILKELEKEEAI